MKYNNIYEFLDEKLSSISNPSDEQIRDLKNQYYKLWHKFYNRHRRLDRKEFTLGFRADILKQIDTKRGGLTVSKYLYKVVFNALIEADSSRCDSELLLPIHHGLLKVANQLEELLDSESNDALETILESIEAIEMKLKKL